MSLSKGFKAEIGGKSKGGEFLEEVEDGGLVEGAAGAALGQPRTNPYGGIPLAQGQG